MPSHFEHETFHEYVYILEFGWNMKNANVPNNKFVNVFCTLVLDWVGQCIYSTDIAVIDNVGDARSKMKHTKQFLKPNSFETDISSSLIFYFDSQKGDYVLSFGGPRHKVVAYENTIPRIFNNVLQGI